MHQPHPVAPESAATDHLACESASKNAFAVINIHSQPTDRDRENRSGAARHRVQSLDLRHPGLHESVARVLRIGREDTVRDDLDLSAEGTDAPL